MARKKYKRLSLKERVIIQTLLEEKKSRCFIAEKLGRSRSTITRELHKWLGDSEGKYDASLAQWNAEDDYLNKRNRDKINSNKRLKMYVYRGLLKDWSPEQIAGRIKQDYPLNFKMRISYEAIYCHIYAHRQAQLNKKLIKLLPYQKSQRRRVNVKTKRGSKIKDQVSIDQRPKYIDNRLEIGHWEGDLVIGKGQKSAIGTIVERTSRYTCIVKISSRKSAVVRKQFVKAFSPFQQNIAKTMTYDNGVEMAQHKTFTKQTGIQVYFAHPYASWERGTNENTNGLIRRYFPKKTDFNTVTEHQLKQVQMKLNNRPRKVLNYKTPMEIMIQNSS